MGANNSSPNILPYPNEWLEDATPELREAAIDAVKAISAMDIDKFLAVRAPLPELEDTVWGPAWETTDSADQGPIAFKDHAVAAVQASGDPLNKLVYKCVPKRVPESEFWRCYFCWVYHAVTALDEEAGGGVQAPPPLSMTLLDKGDDTTSNAIISTYRGQPAFDAFAKSEMEDIMKRDAEDDEKLAAGIQMAVDKGVLPRNPRVEPLKKVDVLGKSADIVAAEIIRALGKAPSKGCVLVLQGLSGTGKGTTCAKLQEKLPRCTSWSNGNGARAAIKPAHPPSCDSAGPTLTHAFPFVLSFLALPQSSARLRSSR